MIDPQASLVSEAAPIHTGCDLLRRTVTYTLRYDEDAVGLPKRIEFEADSPAAALEIAMGEAEGRRALLLADGAPLCQLVKAACDSAPY
ncbi:MAG: hypothetical protein HEQ22_04315 [Sphingopyxis sp.]|uniref:hypothetical protein n=1 Tax=Sphingopyxis sp. TaxID=1908224 RepID=UPI003D80E539